MDDQKQQINGLIDGKYAIKDLLDVDRLSGIFERFSKATGSTIGLLSYPEQEILISAGLRDVCTKFHRANRRSAEACFRSNVSMTGKLRDPGDINVEACDNGLVDGGTPIVVKGRRVATLVTGQVFFAPPDIERFTKQARAFGFDEEEYLKDVRAVPVVTEEQFRATLSFLGEIAILVTELSYDRLAARERSGSLEREVAERRRAEERVVHLNAVLRAAGRVNQLIVEQKDAHAILEGVCRIIAECRDYSLVWVGSVSDKGFDVLPVAHGGLVTDYLESIRVTWDDSPYGWGPAGTAIKTRKGVAIQDISSDPIFAPWRDNALKHGYGSMVSVPVCWDTRVYAIINVYASRPGAFDAEEVGLLSELAGDIGVALHSIDVGSEREQFEEALEYERNILSTTINTLPVYIYFKDTESRFIMANSATAHAMGAKTPEELVGKTDSDYYPREMAERFFADEQEVIRTGMPLESREEQLKTAAGEIQWLLTSKVPMRDRSGKVIGLVGVGRNITERKQAEEEIKREKLFGDTVIGTVPGLFYVLDKDGRYLRWSKTNEDLFGRSAEEMWHYNVFETIHEEDRERLAHAMQEVFTKGYIEGEGRVVTRHGPRLYYFTARKMVEGDQIYIVGTGIDITDRKRAEDALIVSEESYRAIFNSVNDAIFVHDIETGQIVDVNDKACEMFVYPKEEMVRLSLQELSSGEEPYTHAEAIGYFASAARGEAQLFEWMARDKAQRPFWVEINLRRAVVGGKYRILSIVRDISERKRSEDRWAKIHTAFLSFEADPVQNINRLTALCGEILGGDCALYNRIEDGQIRACVQWNTPPGFVPAEAADGQICSDIVRQGGDQVAVIRDLQETDYARTDPNVAKFGLKTYVGKAVKFGDSCIGILSIVYQHHFDPSEEDREMVGFIALAISVEEERRGAEEVSQIAQFAIEHSADPIFWIGPDGRIMYVNEMSSRSLGYTKEELLELKVSDIDPEFPDERWPSHWQEVKERRSFSFESKHRRKDGTVFPVEATVNYIQFQGSEYNFVFARDISVRKAQEEALLRRDYQLEILSRTSQHVNAVLETQTILRTVVTAAIELVDATAGAAGVSFEGKMVFKEYCKDGKIVPVDYAFEPGEGICSCLARPVKTYICNDAHADERVSAKMREIFGIENLVNVPIVDRNGDILGCIEIHNKKGGRAFDAQDVFMLQGLAASASVALENASALAQRDSAEKALEWQKSYYETLLSEANVWIEVVDKEGAPLIWNKRAEELTGYMKSDVIGSLRQWSLLYPDRAKRNKVLRFFRKVIAAGKTVKDIETEIVVSAGEKKTISWSTNAIRDSAGRVMGSMLIGNDVTERKRAEAERERLGQEVVRTNARLKQLALKDAQTGLYNHHYLSEIIESEFYRAKRYGHPFSIVTIDIDYFKSVNDLYGHEFGDLVLKQFATYLRRMVRRYDVVVRFGGEEFIVLSSGTDRQKAVGLARRILDAVGTYSFGDRKHAIRLKLSMAVASYPEDRITKGMDLVDLGDKVLSAAKESGGNTVFSSDDIKTGKRALAGRADISFLKGKIARLTRRGKQSLIESIFAFAKTLEMRDHYTGRHAESTVHYSTEIGQALKLGREDMDNIKQAAVLHDLGKVGISDRILHKRSKLTAKEYDEIKKHPQIAADIIRPIQFMRDIIPLILYHHERWDGKGYPAGLKREEIPVGARIISIADVYQALTSDRPYRKAYSKKEAMKIVKEGSGTQFDPAIVKAFLEILKREKDTASE